MSRQAILALCLAALALLGTSMPADADTFVQRNPARVAPANINDIGPPPNTGASMDHNEYPAFSLDGKLFFWTRQENPTPGTQWLWVSYFKNRDAFDSTPPGATLPALQMSTPWEIHLVNHQFQTDPVTGAPPPLYPAVPLNADIRAVAVCDESDPNYVFDYPNRWRYRVTLYLSVGDVTVPLSEMWRQHRLVINVDKATGEITSIETAPTTLTPIEVIPEATAHGGGRAQEIEPMVTRDGKYLFWASNKWGGTGRVAEYIFSSTACGMINQTPQPYTSLPVGEFGWEDQYSGPQPIKQRTSRTNYHAMVELLNGRKAFIFEECQGQVQCGVDPTPPSRDCDCDADNEQLSTTGFFAGGGPTVIANRAGLSGNQLLWVPGGRTTHPVISGPRNPDGSWLLFFMRGKKIWYTKIDYVP
ncbi:MAG: hypothetical protein AAGC60_08380 [Acidobacteriota bacterium]